MGKTHRHLTSGEDYPVLVHRVPRKQAGRMVFAEQIEGLRLESAPEVLILPGVDELGGIARDRMLTLIQQAAEDLTSTMATIEQLGNQTSTDFK